LEYAISWTKGKLTDQSKQLIVALDHGMSFPDIQGLERPLDTLKSVLADKNVDGIIAAPGVYRQAENMGLALEDINRLITVDFVATKQVGELTCLAEREIILDPEEAGNYRPDCFKMFFNVYSDKKEMIRNARDLSRFAVVGRRLHISCLAEVVFFGNEAFLDPDRQAEELYNGCRTAMEVGADVLKIPIIKDTKAMCDIIEKLQMPTFLLGGMKQPTRKGLTDSLKSLNEMPICGLMFGRNVWQCSDMQGVISQIKDNLR
jgi:DhnA family fructose-bisphosphate aldolase class Ia